MKRLARISTIWRKELIDTLRDKRTLIAMIVVPMVLYPAMMLGSLQGFELQVSRLKRETYKVAVVSEDVRTWLRLMIDSDPARQPGVAERTAEELAELREQRAFERDQEGAPAPEAAGARDEAQVAAEQQPPDYEIEVATDQEAIREGVLAGDYNVGLLLADRIPERQAPGSAGVVVVLDQTDIRSQIAASGLRGVLDRVNQQWLHERLVRAGLSQQFLEPLHVEQVEVATPEKVGGSILGQIVPLILIIMTVTGAIYPAIDLTAGERERGTLETLMVAPVPTVDLIAGKFVVVALIAMLSALLNLLSIGGTVYLGGLGQLLTQGGEVVIPLGALPWVLLVLIPLAVMFSATLLAVCSFARSFKEAQNYVMPVMVAVMIPAVVGILPGTRLEGPMLIVPVTNIVILTRDLFTGRFEVVHIIWVMLSSTLYAGAAVAVAAKLFGQEAVLFADSGSIKTIFQRKFFKRTLRPTAAQAFLLMALVFSVNFFAQQQLLSAPGVFGTLKFWWGIAGLLVGLFVVLPILVALYTRTRLRTAFELRPPNWVGIVAAICIGLSTWILAQAWLAFQQSWLPIPPEMEQAFQAMEGMLAEMSAPLMFFFMALLPAICEELFFRGFALSGTRGALGKVGAVLVVAIAFGLNHHSIHRMFITTGLGLLFGLLVVQYRSVWPAIVAHLLHNGIYVLSGHEDGLKPVLDRLGYAVGEHGVPALPWVVGAAILTATGIAICLLAPRPAPAVEPAGLPATAGSAVSGSER